jgi:hypothetical protein
MAPAAASFMPSVMSLAASSISVTATPDAPVPATMARSWPNSLPATGVSRVAIVPRNAGLLLASAQPRCNTRYRQQAITPINLPAAWDGKLGAREWTSTPTLNSRYG